MMRKSMIRFITFTKNQLYAIQEIIFHISGEALINNVSNDDQDGAMYGATGQIYAGAGENRESKSGKCC